MVALVMRNGRFKLLFQAKGTVLLVCLWHIQTKRTVPLVCEEFSEKVVVKADQTTYTLPQLTPKP